MDSSRKSMSSTVHRSALTFIPASGTSSHFVDAIGPNTTRRCAAQTSEQSHSSESCWDVKVPLRSGEPPPACASEPWAKVATADAATERRCPDQSPSMRYSSDSFSNGALHGVIHPDGSHG